MIRLSLGKNSSYIYPIIGSLVTWNTSHEEMSSSLEQVMVVLVLGDYCAIKAFKA